MLLVAMIMRTMGDASIPDEWVPADPTIPSTGLDVK